MKLEIVNVSVVVLANQHNPTILHPAFLEGQKIVPGDWEPAEDPLCTPPFARVVYKNGIELVAELSKFQVLDTRPPEDPGQSVAPRVASDYIAALPHVKYTAVGLNIVAFLEQEHPESYVVQAFLKDGPWRSGKLQPNSLTIALFYEVDGAVFQYKCDPGARSEPSGGQSRRGLVVSGNYHTPLSQQTADEGRGVIERFQDRCSHFLGIVGDFFEGEG